MPCTRWWKYQVLLIRCCSSAYSFYPELWKRWLWGSLGGNICNFQLNDSCPGNHIKVKESVSFINTQVHGFQLCIPDWWFASWFHSPFQSHFAFSWNTSYFLHYTSIPAIINLQRGEYRCLKPAAPAQKILVWRSGIQGWRCLTKLHWIFAGLFILFFSWFVTCEIGWNILQDPENILRNKGCSYNIQNMSGSPTAPTTSVISCLLLGHITGCMYCVAAGLHRAAHPCPNKYHFQPGEVLAGLLLADKCPHILWCFLPAGQQ